MTFLGIPFSYYGWGLIPTSYLPPKLITHTYHQKVNNRSEFEAHFKSFPDIICLIFPLMFSRYLILIFPDLICTTFWWSNLQISRWYHHYRILEPLYIHVNCHPHHHIMFMILPLPMIYLFQPLPCPPLSLFDKIFPIHWNNIISHHIF